MKQIKDCIISRYKPGFILEADWSSLEVCAAAQLSGDIQMAEDIISGKDMHKFFASKIFNKPESEISKEERQKAKIFSFQLLYGAGARKLAATWDEPLEVCEAFINEYYNRYPDLLAWQKSNIETVKQNAKITSTRLSNGELAKAGWLVNPTGRRFVFVETLFNDSPNINPTRIKNFPVQSFATADVVLIMIGKLWRLLLHYRDKCAIINTVHDSIIIDVKGEYITEIAKLTKDTLESSDKVLEDLFNVKLIVPLKVEVSYGTSWGSQEYKYVESK